jgi:hypothetical protein
MGKLKHLKHRKAGLSELRSEISLVSKMSMPKDKFSKKPYSSLPVFLKRFLYSQEKRKIIKYLNDEIDFLKKIEGQEVLDWEKIHHIVIIPFWKEPKVVLKRSLDKLANQSFPTKQISIVLGAEARHPPAYKLALELKKEYEKVFENVWVNNHELSGEDIVGKASNMASAGKYALKEIEKLGWNKDFITITSCDSDTQFHEQYFAYLTYFFVSDSKRYTHFYAAPMIYYANIWRIPFYSRIANTLYSINNIATAVRLDKFIQVSSYSFSWKLLEDIDFWSVDVIPEDFHMFFKALYIYNDDVMTIPIYLRNLSDAAESIGHIRTIKNQYEQVKRWAWGTSDHGWMIRNLLSAKVKTPYMFYRVGHTIFDHLTWSVTSFILMFGANIPPLVNRNFSQTVFGQKLPKVSSFMLTISTIAFVFTVVLDFFLKPRRNEKISIFRFLLEQFQWITFPIVSFFFGAIPGLDAQTRLLFGKYLEYRLTEKH